MLTPVSAEADEHCHQHAEKDEDRQTTEAARAISHPA
jgi:hypothetical protein